MKKIVIGKKNIEFEVIEIRIYMFLCNFFLKFDINCNSNNIVKFIKLINDFINNILSVGLLTTYSY